VKGQATTFQIVPQIRGHLKKQNGSQALECSSSYSTLKASIASQILTTTGDREGLAEFG
jgi:hypothetical protein